MIIDITAWVIVMKPEERCLVVRPQTFVVGHRQARPDALYPKTKIDVAFGQCRLKAFHAIGSFKINNKGVRVRFTLEAFTPALGRHRERLVFVNVGKSDNFYWHLRDFKISADAGQAFRRSYAHKPGHE